MQIACDEAKWHGLIGGTLNLARAEHSCSIAIEQQAQQHFWCVGFPTTRPIAGIQRREVKQGHTVHHETGQMVRRQTVPQAYCQIQRLVIVHGFECSFHAHSLPLLTSWRLLLSDKLLERPELGKSCLRQNATFFAEDAKKCTRHLLSGPLTFKRYCLSEPVKPFYNKRAMKQ